MNTEEIARIVGDQRAYFKTHATFDVDVRRRALVSLRDAVRAHEADIAHALKTDLGKSHDEAYMCEIGTSLSEIRHQIAHVARWSRPRLRPCDLANAVSVCKTQTVPYGVTLIMAPWNYPFLLTLEPLAGALAAGNTVVIKPSAYAPASSAVLRQICEEAFDPRLVTVVEGGAPRTKRCSTSAGTRSSLPVAFRSASSSWSAQVKTLRPRRLSWAERVPASWMRRQT